MKTTVSPAALGLLAAVPAIFGLPSTTSLAGESQPTAASIVVGRHEIRTVPWPSGYVLRTATYTPSGKVLAVYAKNQTDDLRQINLATINDDGTAFRPFFSGSLPLRPKDNGVRYMVFPDNKRIFLGDFVIECATSLEECRNPQLLPVQYPAEVADGAHISHRWSEMIVAPDNRHIAWTTLLANSAMVFTGELRKRRAGYVIERPRIVSTIDPFTKDLRHADGTVPLVVRGGEVKQFVHGGTALSLAGGTERDIADSVVQDLASGRMEVVTRTPGYDETTIFSPDERLGVVMSPRFSPMSDLAVLGLLPRPYPDSLNIGLNMLAYTYSVTGVRASRRGNVGPVLIDIAASRSQPGYAGVSLNMSEDWVFSSPISWHPSSTRAMWIERTRASNRLERATRIQIVQLPDYRARPSVRTRVTPDAQAYASSDLALVKVFAEKAQNIDVKVYGRRSGFLTYKRTPLGVIEKAYFNFSDDGRQVYSGQESIRLNPRGRSTYIANITLTGPNPGAMDLKVTFGPISGSLPAEIIFASDEGGRALSRGFAEYGGRRLQIEDLIP